MNSNKKWKFEIVKAKAPSVRASQTNPGANILQKWPQFCTRWLLCAESILQKPWSDFAYWTQFNIGHIVNAFDKNRSWLNFTLSPCNTPLKYERNYRGDKRHFLFSSIMHYSLWAREGVTLRISELFLLFEADPNISDGNSALVSHFIHTQILQMNSIGSKWTYWASCKTNCFRRNHFTKLNILWLFFWGIVQCLASKRVFTISQFCTTKFQHHCSQRSIPYNCLRVFARIEGMFDKRPSTITVEFTVAL